jgi:cyclopropane-fatty-acyl-phospholipid synthase
MGDLGFSEAYMYGEVECDDLVALFRVSIEVRVGDTSVNPKFQIFLVNRPYISDMNSVISPVFSLMSRLVQTRFINTISNSKSNISAHYDISNTMFEGVCLLHMNKLLPKAGHCDSILIRRHDILLRHFRGSGR